MTNYYFKVHVHDVFLYLPFTCENLNHFTLLIEMCVNVWMGGFQRKKKGKIKKFIVKLVHVLFYLKIVFENIINEYEF